MFSNTIMFKVYTNTTLFPMRLIWDINYLKRIGLSYTILMFIFYLLVLAIKLHQDCTNIHLHTLASYPYPHFSHNYTKEWVKERHARMVNVTFPNSHRLLVVSLRRIWPLIPLFKCTANFIRVSEYVQCYTYCLYFSCLYLSFSLVIPIDIH